MSGCLADTMRFNEVTSRNFIVFCFLFVAAWAPRVAGLDQTVTVDERKWLARSGNFFQAISHSDWASTFQRGHPGVTIMWAGMLGFAQLAPDYPEVVPSAHWEGEQLEAWLRQSGRATPLELLAAGRWWVALLISLLITASYFPLRRLFGGKLAFLLALFVAWNPFLLALSRQLHPDGLVANFIYLAALYLLAWLYAGQAHRDLILSGILLGLAWATKAPAILLLPAGGLLFLLAIIRRYRALTPMGDKATFLAASKHWLGAGLCWGMVAVMTFVAIWPAMWVHPLGTLQQMALEMAGYVEGHVSANYFWGQTVNDPGYLFYPVVYLLRTTPATLLGLALASLGAWRRWQPFDQSVIRQWAGALVLLALTFAVGMTFGGKKFDRYLLPVFPLLDLLAALGWVGLTTWIMAWWRQRQGQQDGDRPQVAPATTGALRLAPDWQRPALVLGLAVTLGLHGLLGFVHYPYYLTYYNPLFGGSATAANVLMLGWGEGLDAAAAWLNQQPDAEQVRVASSYGDGPLSYFLRSQRPVLSLWTPDFWFDADYVVLYVNQWQRRDIIPEIVDYFSAQTPVYVVRSHGLELARIYAMRGKTPPDFAGVYTESATTFDNQLYLAAYSMGLHSFLTGDRFTIRLYWKKLAPVEQTYVATTQLIAPNGQTVGQSQHTLGTEDGDDWPLYGVYYDEHELIVPTVAASGVYTVQVTLAVSDPDTPVLLADSQSRADEEPRPHAVTTIAVQAAERHTTNVQWGDTQLVALQHEAQTKPGETLWVDMTMAGNLDPSHKLSARLVDPAGVTVAQTDKTLAPTMRFDLTLPAEAATGIYQLVAVLYEEQTLASLPDSTGEHLLILATVEVVR